MRKQRENHFNLMVHNWNKSKLKIIKSLLINHDVNHNSQARYAQSYKCGKGE